MIKNRQGAAMARVTTHEPLALALKSSRHDRSNREPQYSVTGTLIGRAGSGKISFILARPTNIKRKEKRRKEKRRKVSKRNQPLTIDGQRIYIIGGQILDITSSAGGGGEINQRYSVFQTCKEKKQPTPAFHLPLNREKRTKPEPAVPTHARVRRKISLL